MKSRRKTKEKVCLSCKSKNFKITRNGEIQRAFFKCSDCGLGVSWDWAGKGREFD